MSKNMKGIVKTLHLLSACLWLGTAASLVLLQCLRGWSEDGWQLLALNRSFSILDIGLIIPGAMGSAFTGFIICRNTGWGFTRYWWIIVKGTMTLSLILIGTFCLGPWQMRMAALSEQPVSHASYETVRALFTAVGFLQVGMLIIILAISALKPWGKRISRQIESDSIRSQANAAV